MAIDLSKVCKAMDSQEILPWTWQILLASMYGLCRLPITDEQEVILVDVVKFQGAFPLNYGKGFNHPMSVETVAKLMAIQALLKWTGAKHLQVIRDYATGETASPDLRKVVQKRLETPTWD